MILDSEIMDHALEGFAADPIHTLFSIIHLFLISLIFQYVRYVHTREHIHAAGHIPFETP